MHIMNENYIYRNVITNLSIVYIVKKGRHEIGTLKQYNIYTELKTTTHSLPNYKFKFEYNGPYYDTITKLDANNKYKRWF